MDFIVHLKINNSWECKITIILPYRQHFFAKRKINFPFPHHPHRKLFVSKSFSAHETMSFLRLKLMVSCSRHSESHTNEIFMRLLSAKNYPPKNVFLSSFAVNNLSFSSVFPKNYVSLQSCFIGDMFFICSTFQCELPPRYRDFKGKSIIQGVYA